MTRFAALLAGLLLVAGGCQSRSTPNQPAPPPPAVANLMRETRKALPRWSVTYEAKHQVLEIERKQAVLTSGPVIINGPPDDKPEKPTATKPSMSFRVEPYIAPADWQAKYASLQKRMIALARTVSPPQGKEVMDSRLYAHSAAEKPQVDEYNHMVEEQSDLPDYHYQDIGLNLIWYDGHFEPFEGIVNESEQQECRQAYDRFLGLLEKYQPKYQGLPYQDSLHAGGPQKIPGAVFCAYYDEGGQTLAYLDSDRPNRGSGMLNPADGSYLNEFRRGESLDISYTKQVPDRESPCNKVVPPLGLLYVGWNDLFEWFKLTVQTEAAGTYVADLLYTAQRDAGISISVDDGPPVAVDIASTFDPAETIPWRQWHHWNVARDAVVLTLPRGTCVLTVHIEKGGNLNLATLLFRPAGSARAGSDITAFCTALP